MKKVMLIAQLLAASVPLAYGQQASPVIAQQATVVPQRLEICLRKTTNLIFSAAIKSVDRGSSDVLVQKPEGVDNVLKVKAAKEYFLETNLTVITADGQFYSFTVEYANSPSNLVIQVRPGYIGATTAPSKPALPAIFSNTANNEKLVAALAAQASVTKRNIHRVHDKTYEMEGALRGLYTADNLFFYKLILTNESNIEYNIEAIRFFIEDKKKVKRTASQQISLQPISIIGNNKPVPAHSDEMIIVTLPKETIAKDKHLIIEVDEKSGGRNLICTLDNKVLLKAKTIVPAKDFTGNYGNN